MFKFEKINNNIMAVSKAFLFSFKGQVLSTFGKAVGHPARAEMLARLVEHGVLSYSELVDGFPLKRGSISDHLNKLKSAGLVESVLLANNLAGFQLNQKTYDRCIAQISDQFPSFHKEGVVVERGWVRDYEAEYLSCG
ncbi:MAG: helix-turn-helix domain-containing protein [Lewinella sp.]|jgi:DNA-binding transcriptional ArsR family regulator|nr:helix-turn-helix domain-containing protein [Lewinella sp.]